MEDIHCGAKKEETMRESEKEGKRKRKKEQVGAREREEEKEKDRQRIEISVFHPDECPSKVSVYIPTGQRLFTRLIISLKKGFHSHKV